MAADALAALRARTPARLVVGRAGVAYRTATQLELREDHAAAVDAVATELNIRRDFSPALLDQFQLFEVTTVALSKAEYLRRPELGRKLSAGAAAEIGLRCPRGADLQVAIGDGLSAAAVVEQVPALLPLLERGAQQRGWTFGQPFVIHHCRVGVLNDIGELLDAAVVVLLIGERPGLATAVSLSAYLAYRPRAGHTDAERNLISNIHSRGVPPQAAAERILALAAQLRAAGRSGVTVKEKLPEATLADPAAGGRLPG
jgi:ethanolamine ammonia-lyase small subunit